MKLFMHSIFTHFAIFGASCHINIFFPNQGFTYVAPSVLEDNIKQPHVVRARSPRKHSGNIFRPPFNNLQQSTPFDFESKYSADAMDTSTPKCF